MVYDSLASCIDDLEKHGHLVRIKKEVDPYLEMASIHLRVYKNNGPAVFFEKVKGSPFPAVSNLFGSLERSEFMFRKTLPKIKKLISLKSDPFSAFKKPLQNLDVPLAALSALPKKVRKSESEWSECQISDLPQLHSWPNDGGAFITLPAVYTEDMDKPGIMNSNLGMYRIQLSGNEYVKNKEIGLHYQIHRGIGVHQSKANAHGKPLKVSIFVGGPPSLPFAAVMPLPEGLSELVFAGALGGRRFRYFVENGYTIAADADFVITGEVFPGSNKPEGPFGDHLGYYSLKHDFPVMNVYKVYHKKNAIWPFTVVGRPPQEDTSFGKMIHQITGDVIPSEIPGLHEVNAVDEAGVHPLLFALGSERYTPYQKTKKPAELLTIANHILGFGQMSLAKFLWIGAKEDNPLLSVNDKEVFISHMLERVDWKNDLHFYTKTSIDTLDYSGEGLNSGSKLVIAAVGDKKRSLSNRLPDTIFPGKLENPMLVAPGILAFSLSSFESYDKEKQLIDQIATSLIGLQKELEGFPLLLFCDDSDFLAKDFSNFLWVTFTRSNPSHDIYGVGEIYENKHWGCSGSLIIDCRKKPHHAPELLKDPEVEKKVDQLGKTGQALHGII